MSVLNLEVVRKARAEFPKAFESEPNACAMVGFVTNNGLIVSENTACHASLGEADEYLEKDSYRSTLYETEHDNDYEWDNNAPLITVISGFMLPMAESESDWEEYNITREMLKTFVNWMLTESPWQACFLNLNAEDVIDNHWVMDIDQQHQLFANAAFATRLASEYPQQFLVWYELVSKGHSGIDAYAAAMMLKAKRYTEVYPVVVQVMAGHSPIDYLSGEMYKNLVNNTPKFKDNVTYAQRLRYGRVNEIWGRTNQWSYSKFDDIRPVIERKQENLDIFWQNKPRAGGYEFHNYEELLSAWTQIKQKIGALDA